ncbi:ABC transporter permease [Microbacterium sp. USTB-Y]|uniref:ABC transporter permease n=1 Tax=Microbacterium sp. USTB-Y TaxID=2823692 RepID=UPI00203A6E67|nr:ABC transporter permease [Microbacterium sp. USTB-Y]
MSNALRSPILWLIFRRIGGAVLVLFGATLLTFVLMNVISGGAAQQILGPDATAEQIAQLEAKLGLDQPPLNRYLGWLGGTLTGNFGTSLTSGQPVSAIIASRAPVSFELVLLAFLLGVICAFPVALMAARKPGGVADRIGMAVSVSGLSIAGYVVALVLVLVFAVNLRLFPAIGYIPISKGLGPNLWSLALPAIAMALPGFAFYARFLRGDLIEQMQQDYALVAKSKGLPPGRVLVFHALRNSLTGLLTVVALNLGALIGSTVIMEQIFGLPGIGKLLLEGIVNRDIAVVQACVLIFAAIVVVANLAVDILYAVIDPRIRHGRD